MLLSEALLPGLWKMFHVLQLKRFQVLLLKMFHVLLYAHELNVNMLPLCFSFNIIYEQKPAKLKEHNFCSQ